MKTIEAVSIWDNGVVEQATVLNAYAINVNLNQSATFWYGLMKQTEEGYVSSTVAQGNLNMLGEDYLQWEVDSYAWDWVAAQLGLVITGEYIDPIPPEPVPAEPIVETIEEPVVEPPVEDTTA